MHFTFTYTHMDIHIFNYYVSCTFDKYATYYDHIFPNVIRIIWSGKVIEKITTYVYPVQKKNYQPSSDKFRKSKLKISQAKNGKKKELWIKVQDCLKAICNFFFNV